MRNAQSSVQYSTVHWANEQWAYTQRFINFRMAYFICSAILVSPSPVLSNLLKLNKHVKLIWLSPQTTKSNYDAQTWARTHTAKPLRWFCLYVLNCIHSALFRGNRIASNNATTQQRKKQNNFTENLVILKISISPFV